MVVGFSQAEVAREAAQKREQIDALFRLAKEKDKLLFPLDLVITSAPFTDYHSARSHLGAGTRDYSSYPKTQIPVEAVQEPGKSLLTVLKFWGNPQVVKGDVIRASMFLGEKKDIPGDSFNPSLLPGGGGYWVYSHRLIRDYVKKRGVYIDQTLKGGVGEFYVYIPREPGTEEDVEILQLLKDGKPDRGWRTIFSTIPFG